MRIVTAAICLFLIILVSETHGNALFSRRRAKLTKLLEANGLKKIHALREAHHLTGLLKYCQQNPSACAESRLAGILYDIEGEDSSNGKRKNSVRRKRRRSRRSSNLLFMLFDHVKKNPSMSNSNLPRASNQGGGPANL